MQITGSLHSGGRSVEVVVGMREDVTGQTRDGKAFFPLSQLTELADSFYYWLSARGTKGIDHLSGAVFLGYLDGVDEEIMPRMRDLMKARDYSNR